MNLATWIILGVVALILAGAVISVVRQKKRGGCAGCSGGKDGCSCCHAAHKPAGRHHS